jgi:hypothetical protein
MGFIFVFLSTTRRIFGTYTEEVTGGRRKLRNEERHKLDSSPNIIRVIKSRRISYVGHVAGMGLGVGFIDGKL